MKITVIPINVQCLDTNNFHITVNVKIGRRNEIIVVDTGASHSCLSPEVIQHLSSKEEIIVDKVLSISADVAQNTMIKLPSIKIGDFQLRNYPFLIIDIAHINDMMESLGMKKIAGLLGSDILLKYNAIIDYQNRLLTLTK